MTTTAPEAPTVSEATARVYAGLPEVYRDADPATGYQLLRYLSLLGDQLGDVEVLLDRFTDRGELVDPALADPRWLEWLAQLVGVRAAGATTAEARDLITGAATGWRAGTPESIRAAARGALTGSRYVDVRPDGAHRIRVQTVATETPDPAAVTAAVERAGVRPAGHTLAHTFYAASWDVLEARYPTWADVDLVASWDALESTAA